LSAFSIASDPSFNALHREVLTAARLASLTTPERWAHVKTTMRLMIPLLTMSIDVSDAYYDHLYEGMLMYLRIIGDASITRYIMEAVTDLPGAATLPSSRVWALICNEVHPDEAQFIH
jgi:hypothetical protein